MVAKTTALYIKAAASASQTLPVAVAAVTQAMLITGSATWAAPIQYTIQTTTPSTGQLQFTGTPAAPSASITLGAAASAGDVIIVFVVLPGDLPASQ